MSETRDKAWKLIVPSIKVMLLMLVLAGIAYPLSLVFIGQAALPFQSNGSMLSVNGKAVGSQLIAQEFNSSKFFHPRPAADSASGLDPHITAEDAYSQVSRISNATGIDQNPIKTLIRLNIETNRSQNLGAFAPDYVNVLTINLDLIDQYPKAYSEFNGGSNQTSKEA